MKVLGISPLDKDATAALVEDGRVLFAAGEERFSRIKQHSGFPHAALAAALEHAGIGPEEIDLVVYPFLDSQREAELIWESIADEERFLERCGTSDPGPLIERALSRVPRRTAPIHGLREPNQRLRKGPLKRLLHRFAGIEPAIARPVALRCSREWARRASADHRRWQAELEECLRALGLLGKLRRGEHHQSHAAGAYLASGFERALIVTLDGYGSGLAGSVSLGEGGRIHRLHGLRFPHSLGCFYEAVTSSLGFVADRHAGKVVGLAAHGDPAVLAEVLLARAVRGEAGFELVENLSVHFSRHLAALFPMVDVAAGYQGVLETLATGLVRHWARSTGCSSVVLSGGVAANVKLNQRVHELPEVERTFVYPNMGDGGCGTGLALLHSWPGGVSAPLGTVYLGPEFTRAQIRAALDEAGLGCAEPADLAAEVAARIHRGEVVARFDGRMEYGPRALGNRSILCRASDPAVNQWLNRRLDRTEFMPFAPVTLWEARERCYVGVRGAEHAAEFMTITFDCTEAMRESCPAAVHVDGTARPQLLRRETNPGYHAILAEYERLSGIPSLINTSFNMHEQPIVCSPRDAVRAFLEGGLDALAIGPFLVPHPTPGSDRGAARAAPRR